jgi:hypothetical protein
MNIVELRNYLCAVENRRKAAIQDEEVRLHSSVPFEGHICTLPTGIKTYADLYWMCSQCKQYWHIKIVSNKHCWTMFGKLPVTQQVQA